MKGRPSKPMGKAGVNPYPQEGKGTKREMIFETTKQF
jgi:hypothetical protein